MHMGEVGCDVTALPGHTLCQVYTAGEKAGVVEKCRFIITIIITVLYFVM